METPGWGGVRWGGVGLRFEPQFETANPLVRLASGDLFVNLGKWVSKFYMFRFPIFLIFEKMNKIWF